MFSRPSREVADKNFPQFWHHAQVQPSQTRSQHGCEGWPQSSTPSWALVQLTASGRVGFLWGLAPDRLKGSSEGLPTLCVWVAQIELDSFKNKTTTITKTTTKQIQSWMSREGDGSERSWRGRGNMVFSKNSFLKWKEKTLYELGSPYVQDAIFVTQGLSLRIQWGFCFWHDLASSFWLVWNCIRFRAILLLLLFKLGGLQAGVTKECFGSKYFDIIICEKCHSEVQIKHCGCLEAVKIVSSGKTWKHLEKR